MTCFSCYILKCPKTSKDLNVTNYIDCNFFMWYSNKTIISKTKASKILENIVYNVFISIIMHYFPRAYTLIIIILVQFMSFWVETIVCKIGQNYKKCNKVVFLPFFYFFINIFVVSKKKRTFKPDVICRKKKY